MALFGPPGGAVDQRTYTPLEQARLAQVIGILQRERAEHRIPRWSIRVYWLLNVSIGGTIAALFAALFTAEKSPARDALGIVGALFLLAALVLFGFCVPMLVKMLRQRRLIWRLGLGGLSTSMWKRRSRSSLLSRVWGALMLTVGVLYLLTGVVAIVQRDVALAIGLMVFAAFFGSVYALRRIKQQHDLLDDVGALEKSLIALPPGAGGTVEVPPETVARLASIESDQIRRGQVQAIVASRQQSAAAGYYVLFTREAADERSSLRARDRLALEELIERLSANPKAAPARPDQGRWLARTEDGGIELDFDLDDAQRQIQVLSVRSRQPAPEPMRA